MYARDTAIRAGQSVQIEVSNKPYIDMTIPPELNDYRYADIAKIEIWEPLNSTKIVDDCMVPIIGRPGWYSYRFQSTECSAMGVYRVVVRLHTFINPVPPSGSPAPSGCPDTPCTTGSSGCPYPSNDCLTDVKVSYFTIMDLY
jgi:hypothetical protein